MPVKDAMAGFSFRMSGRLYPADGCICLYRAIEAEEMGTRYLFLTKDGRFAFLSRVIGGKGIPAAEEWSPDRARRFLVEHGDGDLMEEFAVVFRRRPAVAPQSKPRATAVAPRGRPAEPICFR